MLLLLHPAMRGAVAVATGATYLEECRDLLSQGFRGCQLAPRSLSLQRSCGQMGTHPSRAVGLRRKKLAKCPDTRLCISVHHIGSIFSRAFFDLFLLFYIFSHGRSCSSLYTWLTNLHLLRVLRSATAFSTKGVAGGGSRGVFSQSGDMQQPP